ncbi:MAG: hypothetical protein ACYC7C_05135 [Coriobacteriia bacterium]
MPTTSNHFYTELETYLDWKLPAEYRSFVAARGYEGDYRDALDATERQQVVEDAAGFVQDLRKFALVVAAPVSSDKDGQTSLLHLLAATAEARGLEGTGVVRPAEIRLEIGDLMPARRDRLMILLDRRSSLQDAIAALRDMWPQLITRGWVRRTRPLGARKQRVVKLVCVDMPDASWRERLEAWNTAFPAESYRSVQALNSDFRRGETAVSGEPYGLEEYYEPAARELGPVTMNLLQDFEEDPDQFTEAQQRWLAKKHSSALESIKQLSAIANELLFDAQLQLAGVTAAVTESIEAGMVSGLRDAFSAAFGAGLTSQSQTDSETVEGKKQGSEQGE